MPQTEHIEQHFTASESVRDVVIGMSDGLTVPFALAAGLSGAVTATRIVVTAGFAEIAAGAIAMGLGGYLAAKSDAEHYVSEESREQREIIEKTQDEVAEVEAIFAEYGLQAPEIAPIIQAFQNRPKAWVDFMMRYELGLEKPDPSRAMKSALTIGGAYVAGGLIPLAPYLIVSSVQLGFVISALVTLAALAGFGFVKGRFTGAGPLRSAFQTLLIGGLAASAAFAIARLIA
jgi:VIT1/CCC1 family predicted Fe2+/Mn2+ transporter